MLNRTRIKRSNILGSKINAPCNMRGFETDCLEYHGLIESHIFKTPKEICPDTICMYLHGLYELPDYSISLELCINNTYFIKDFSDDYLNTITRWRCVKICTGDMDARSCSMYLIDFIRFRSVLTRLHGS